MGKNKIKLTEEDLKIIQAERQEKIDFFKAYFGSIDKNDSQDKKADWNNLMPLISKIENLEDAYFHQCKEMVEISYSTEELSFNYSVRYGNDDAKLMAYYNVVNTFINWALKNL